MDKQELLNKKLYTIVSKLTEMPHLMDGKFFLVYSNKEKAEMLAQKLKMKINDLYLGETIEVCEISDCNTFFSEMIYIGFPLFLYDGTGQIHNLSQIYDIDFILPKKNREIYSAYMGYLRMTKSIHIGKVKQTNINRSKMLLNIPENQTIMNKFIERQKRINKSYIAISPKGSYNANIQASTPFPPTLDYFEKLSKEKQ